jgi:deoxyribodipyrimidine photolyase-related protein
LILKGKPQGGQWSFDDENRKKIPKKEYENIPVDPEPLENKYITEAKKYVDEKFADNPGEYDKFWFPIDRESAQKWLEQFLEHRFYKFGDYEDAITESHHVLYHSILSPLLNVGLLKPLDVVNQALDFASKNDIPLNSVEGFVRQIIGWREYIRLQYELNGTKMRNDNLWNHKEKLAKGFWTGQTEIEPLDNVIKKINETGYLHHIERLMIVGNFMFLLQTDPKEVYRWFMSLSIDSYDWVMVPNVYGMSQYSCEDIMTTKPYISGSNYVRKMSNYSKNEWCEIWDALYWNFIIENIDKLSENYRMGMIVNRAKNFSKEKKSEYKKIVEKYKIN